MGRGSCDICDDLNLGTSHFRRPRSMWALQLCELCIITWWWTISLVFQNFRYGSLQRVNPACKSFSHQLFMGTQAQPTLLLKLPSIWMLAEEVNNAVSTDWENRQRSLHTCISHLNATKQLFGWICSTPTSILRNALFPLALCFISHCITGKYACFQGDWIT